MGGSVIGIVVMLLAVVVGLIVGIRSGATPSQRFAIVSSIAALALVVALFCVVVILFSQEGLVPVFVVAGIAVPLVSYGAQMQYHKQVGDGGEVSFEVEAPVAETAAAEEPRKAAVAQAAEMLAERVAKRNAARAEAAAELRESAKEALPEQPELPEEVSAPEPESVAAAKRISAGIAAKFAGIGAAIGTAVDSIRSRGDDDADFEFGEPFGTPDAEHRFMPIPEPDNYPHTGRFIPDDFYEFDYIDEDDDGFAVGDHDGLPTHDGSEMEAGLDHLGADVAAVFAASSDHDTQRDDFHAEASAEAQPEAAVDPNDEIIRRAEAVRRTTEAAFREEERRREEARAAAKREEELRERAEARAAAAAEVEAAAASQLEENRRRMRAEAAAAREEERRRKEAEEFAQREEIRRMQEELDRQEAEAAARAEERRRREEAEAAEAAELQRRIREAETRLEVARIQEESRDLSAERRARWAAAFEPVSVPEAEPASIREPVNPPAPEPVPVREPAAFRPEPEPAPAWEEPRESAAFRYAQERETAYVPEPAVASLRADATGDVAADVKHRWDERIELAQERLSSMDGSFDHLVEAESVPASPTREVAERYRAMETGELFDREILPENAAELAASVWDNWDDVESPVYGEPHDAAPEVAREVTHDEALAAVFGTAPEPDASAYAPEDEPEDSWVAMLARELEGAGTQSARPAPARAAEEEEASAWSKPAYRPRERSSRYATGSVSSTDFAPAVESAPQPAAVPVAESAPTPTAEPAVRATVSEATYEPADPVAEVSVAAFEPAPAFEAAPEPQPQPDPVDRDSLDFLLSKASDLREKGIYHAAAKLYRQASDRADTNTLSRQYRFDQLACLIKAGDKNAALRLADELRQSKTLSRMERVKLDAVQRMA